MGWKYYYRWKKIKTDQKGRITVFQKNKDLKKIIFNTGEAALSEEIIISYRYTVKEIVDIFLNQILSPIIPLIIFIIFVLFYFYKTGKRDENNT